MFESTKNRQPIFNLSPIILYTIIILIAIHIIRIILPNLVDIQIINQFAFIPGRFTYNYYPEQFFDHFNNLLTIKPLSSNIIFNTYIVNQGVKPWSFLTHILLHINWQHLIFNVLWLSIYGTIIERNSTKINFFILAVSTTIIGAITHFLFNKYSIYPSVGVSTLLSGMLGASINIIFPKKQYFTNNNFFKVISKFIPSNQAIIFIIIWISMNTLLALNPNLLGISNLNNIAWEAHIGSFVAGLIIFPLIHKTI